MDFKPEIAGKSGGNATVPNDAPIQPPQAFVDSAVDLFSQDFGLVSGLTGFNGDFEGGDNALFTKADFPLLASLDGIINISASGILEVIRLPVLASLNGTLQLNGNAFASIDFLPVLASINGSLIFVNSSAITSANLPALTTLGASAEVDLSACSIASASFPLLATISSGAHLRLNDNHLTAASFPSLTAIFSLNLSNNSITSVSFPNVHSISDHLTLSNNQLTSISLPGLTSLAGPGAIELDGNQFSSAAVDAFFNALASTITTGTGAAIDISGQTPPAPPTSASATARSFLSSTKGITLITD